MVAGSPPRAFIQRDIGGADPVAVHRGERHVLEAVEGRGDLGMVRIFFPGPGALFLIGGARRHGLRLARLGEGVVARFGPALHRRRVGRHVLEVALADQAGAIAFVPHQVDEGVFRQRQRDTVVADAVQRGHAAGHQGCPVGHAHRVGDIESGRNGRPGRRCRRYGASSGTGWPAQPKIIRPLLVGDDHQGSSGVSRRYGWQPFYSPAVAGRVARARRFTTSAAISAAPRAPPARLIHGALDERRR